MDFYSAYRHGFVGCRVHASHLSGDQVANADSVLRLARACHHDNAALAVFPLRLSGYSIADIVMQDAS